MTKDWTRKEQEWINDMKKILRRKPKNIRLYTHDSEITAAKLNVSSCELSTNIAHEIISASDCISFAHDKLCNKGLVKLR